MRLREKRRSEKIVKSILSEVLIGFLVLITQPGSYSDEAADCSPRVSFLLVHDVHLCDFVINVCNMSERLKRLTARLSSQSVSVNTS